MTRRADSRLPAFARAAATGVGVAAVAYATYAGVTWYRYGRQRPVRRWERDELLDRFMPRYEAVERHFRYINAPAETTLEVAKQMDLERSPIIRAIFKAREIALGATPDPRWSRQGLLPEMIAIGWSVLAEIPGREIVLGAVTRPWESNVTFRALPPDEFAAFDAPDYVKIAWTLRADPVGADHSVFRTETRAVATDAAARRRFRLYWSVFSPGIFLIRWLSLGPLKRDAERRAREGRAAEVTEAPPEKARPLTVRLRNDSVPLADSRG